MTLLSDTTPETHEPEVADSTRLKDPKGLSTQSVHAGRSRDHPYHSLTVPVVQSSTYTFESTSDLAAFMEKQIWGRERDRTDYGRYGNPTVAEVERKIAALEGGQEAALFSSGMAAVTISLFSLLSAGQHLVITADAYRRTRDFCQIFLKRFAVECSVVAPGDLEAIASAIQPNTKLIISESPTNPYLRVLDLEGLVAIARKAGVKTLIDSTFATPINQQPLRFGVDLVLHSGTKYFGGHNDILAGALVGSSEMIALVRQYLGVLGAVLDANTAFLLQRGLKTLALRVRQQNKTAQAVAEFLQSHEKVHRVWYPGLATHPDHQIAASQMRGYGGVVTFELEADLETTGVFIDAVEIPTIAPSFGGVETLIEQPALMSYFDLSPEERLEVGITAGLVRLAIGIEDANDLIADLEQALEKI